MSRNSLVPKKRRSKLLASSAKKARQKVLSFSDLEIPVEPLLSREQEFKSGRKIRLCLERLSMLLPLHPEGYRKFLARMAEVVSGGSLMFSWISLRQRMEADLKQASRALQRVQSLARSKRGRAYSALQDGANILNKYPLDPENRFQWYCIS